MVTNLDTTEYLIALSHLFRVQDWDTDMGRDKLSLQPVYI